MLSPYLSVTFNQSVVFFSGMKSRQRVVVVLWLRLGLLDKY